MLTTFYVCVILLVCSVLLALIGTFCMAIGFDFTGSICYLTSLIINISSGISFIVLIAQFIAKLIYLVSQL